MKKIKILIGLLIFFLGSVRVVVAQRLGPTATPAIEVMPLVQRIILSPTLQPTEIPNVRRGWEGPTLTITPGPVQRVIPTSLPIPTPTPTPTLIPLTRISPKPTMISDIEVGNLASEAGKIKPVTIELKNATGSPAGSLIPITKEGGITDLTFDYQGKLATISALINLRFKQGQTMAVIDEKEVSLKLSPKAFYAAAMAAARSINAEVNDWQLKMNDGKPVYEFNATDTVKLLGFIPYKNNSRVVMDATDHHLVKISRSPLSFLARQKNWQEALALGPNLEIMNVHMYQQSYHAGDTARIVFTLSNTGTESYLPYGKYITVMWRAGEQNVYSRQENPFLDPGESQTYTYYTWENYQCNYPISIEVDLTNNMKETSKQDNVWQGTSICAPNNGPDLAIMEVKPGAYNGEKIIGKQQPVNYTLKNLGDAATVPTRGLMRTLGAQYLALVEIPALAPGEVFSDAAGYTPNDCSLVEMMVDTDKKNTEINEDNNYATEDQAVETHCKSRPDLTVDWIYWLHDGFSHGKPKAGETINLEVRLANSSVDHEWGCAPGVTLGVYQDGNGILNIPYGDIGISDGSCMGGGISGSYDYPYLVSTKTFAYKAVCGANLAFIVDQENMIGEVNENNNRKDIWIECE